jgi:hypothetical protein
MFIKGNCISTIYEQIKREFFVKFSYNTQFRWPVTQTVNGKNKKERERNREHFERLNCVGPLKPTSVFSGSCEAQNYVFGYSILFYFQIRKGRSSVMTIGNSFARVRSEQLFVFVPPVRVSSTRRE